jgi:hypothetical protein
MNQIFLSHAADTPLYLCGAGTAAPFRGAAYSPLGDPLAAQAQSSARSRNDRIDDTIELVLEDNSAGSLSAAYGKIEYFLNLAKDYTANQVGKPVYLECIGAAGEVASRSPVADGWLEIAGGERAHGSVGLRLHMARAPWWETSAEQQLKVALAGQASSLAELAICNHNDDDTGHDNFFRILGADIAGDLPAPCRIEIRASINAIYNFWIGGDRFPSPSGDLFLDNSLFESLFTNTANGTTVADATCSYGHKLNLSWAGAAETLLFQWALLANNTAPGQGRIYKPVMRCPGGIGAADLWLRFRTLGISGNVIWDGPFTLCPSGVEMFDLAPIQVPPNLVHMADKYGPITIECLGKRIAGGATAFSFDYLSLMPTDFFIKGLARSTGCVQGRTLYVDGMAEEIYSGTNRNGGFDNDFQVMGGPVFLLYPGKTHQIMIHTTGSAAAASIWNAYGITVFYRPRRRLL